MPRGIWKQGRADAITRLMSKTVKLSCGCWLYTGGLDPDGYGIFWVNGKSVRVHRYTYEALTDTVIPDELPIDHLCRNRACINPQHMEPVTPRENVIRGILSQVNHEKAQSRTHCSNGHAYTPENTHIRPDGTRRCRQCKRESERRRIHNAA